MDNQHTKIYPTLLNHGKLSHGRMTYIEVSNSLHSRYMDWRTQPDGTRVIQTRAIPGEQYPTEAAARAAVAQELAIIDREELDQAIAHGRHRINLPQARASFLADKPRLQRERADGTLDTLINYHGHILPRREHLEQAFLRGHTVTTKDYDGKTEWVLLKPDQVFSVITKTEADYFTHLAASIPPPSNT